MILDDVYISYALMHLTGHHLANASEDAADPVEAAFAIKLEACCLGNRRPRGGGNLPAVQIAYLVEALDPKEADNPIFGNEEKAVLRQILAHVAL